MWKGISNVGISFYLGRVVREKSIVIIKKRITNQVEERLVGMEGVLGEFMEASIEIYMVYSLHP